jgi:hypothetical protein
LPLLFLDGFPGKPVSFSKDAFHTRLHQKTPFKQGYRDNA